MANFGDALKRQRELREISLREISDATKINIRYLEALEQNRFDVLPGGLFNKGFIRAYATYIGVDCEETVNSYLEELATRASGTADGTAPAPPGLHRPVSTPRRRIDGKDAGSNGRPIAITLASGPAPSTPGRAGTGSIAPAAPTGMTQTAPIQGGSSPSTPEPRASAHAASTASSNPPAPSVIAAEPAPKSRRASEAAPAVSHIEAAEPAASPTRMLSMILMIAGGVGALFLILSLVLKHPAAAPTHALQVETSGAAHLAGSEEVTSSNLVLGSQGGPPEHGAASTAPSTASFGGAGAPAAIAEATAAHPAPVKPAPPRALEPPPANLSQKKDDTGAAAAGLVMDLQVEATAKSWVQLFCDGREAINWVMKEGESESMQCQRAIQVSAADAAAVELRVNGAPCAALGESGSRVHGFTIRIDDFSQICPSAGRGDHGLR